MGGFLAWWRARDLGRSDLARTGDVAEAAAFACRVAAVTCSRAGADPPRLEEVAEDVRGEEDAEDAEG